MSRAWEDKRRRSAVPRGSLPRKLRVSGWWDLATFPSGLTRPLLDPAPWKFPRWFVCYMQLLKVRLTLHLGALSPGAGKDPPTPLSLLCHPAPRTSAAGGGSQETLCRAAGSSRDSPALQPRDAASGYAPCSRLFESFRGKTRATARGALLLLSRARPSRG